MEQYNTQVSPDATQATTPEELHPVAAAFGGDIGMALEKGGEEVASRIQTLSLHMARMNFYRGETQKADLADNYKQGLHDQIHGDPSDPNATVTYTPDASTGATLSTGQAPSNTAPVDNQLERPLGVLNWKGNMANGALDYLDQWHQQASAQVAQQAKGLGLRNLASLKRDIDNAWVSQRDFVADHETKQINQAQIATYMKGMQLDAQNAITAQNPIALGKVLDSISKQNDVLQSSQYGDDNSDPLKQTMSDLTLNKMHNEAINNSMTANLKSTGGDPTQFQATLDRLHDDGKINDTVYDNANGHLTTMSQNIQRQFKITAEANQVSNRLNTFMSIANGKINSSSSPSTISEIGASDPELGNAVSTIVDSNGKYKPERNDKENKEYQKDVTDMINSSSQKQLTDYLTKSLGDKKSLTSTRMNILVNALMQHAKTLPVLDDQAGSSTPQNLTSSAFNALNDWADKAGLSPDDKSKAMDSYLKGMAGNISPKQNYENAIKSHVTKEYPESATMEQPPQQVVDNKELKVAYPSFNKDVKVHAMMRWEEQKKEEASPLEKAAEGENKIKEGQEA